jgi:MFS superfamily sulfate permease-like transporter
MTASGTLTLMVGFILMLAAVLQLGFVANLISDPVLTGFKAGFLPTSSRSCAGFPRLRLLTLWHFLPRAPAPLIAVATAILGVKLFGLVDLGVAAVGAAL